MTGRALPVISMMRWLMLRIKIILRFIIPNPIADFRMRIAEL